MEENVSLVTHDGWSLTPHIKALLESRSNVKGFECQSLPLGKYRTQCCASLDAQAVPVQQPQGLRKRHGRYRKKADAFFLIPTNNSMHLLHYLKGHWGEEGNPEGQLCFSL
ncbi:hypothetical protein Baya_11117 [Bagarius yarrelli]|uniref:Uncharacterized protein n=1 Tax=Bagarius yarrelli TaxID=175774 RepID=A0A556UZ53_BAGYA|nr:hypothetical protein Baya_11117 [Bagarius yarrelli]